MKFFLYILGSITLTIYSSLLAGLVIVKLWLWFITARFGVSPVSIPEAIGLCLLIVYTTHQSNLEKVSKPYWVVLLENAGDYTIRAVIVLLTGEVVKLFL